MANGLSQQVLQSLVPQLGGPRQALGFIGDLEQQRASQQQNQQTELINKITIAQGEASNIASEANAFLSLDTPQKLTAALVQRAAEICEKHERPVATWQQARQILGLRDAV